MDAPDDIRPLAAFTQIGHAFFAKDGVKLAFGRRWDDELIHISQADRGAACGCICPAQDCRRKLIARKPENNIKHHFCHAPLTGPERKAGALPSCRYAPMTVLHEYAGKLLNERRALVLPPVEAQLGSRKRVRRRAKEYGFDAAKLETMDGETIPDVILYKGEHRMHVEVYVAHRCSAEKRAKIVAAEVAAIEIDLSGIDRNATVEEVNRAILGTAPREWIYNRKAQELLKELEDETKAEAEAANKRRQEAVINLAEAYGTARDKALACDWKNADDVIEASERGDAELLTGVRMGEGYFTVHPRVWKAAVLNLLLDRFGRSGPASMIAEFAGRGWLVESLREFEKDDDLVEEAGLPRGGARQAVDNFLQSLARKGVVADEGWQWVYTRQHLGKLEYRALQQQRLVREAADRSSRHNRLAKVVSDILTIGNQPQVAAFDLNAWLAQPINNTGPSIREIADAGGKGWHDLLKGLQTTLAVLKDEAEAKADDFGLPVGDALRAMLAAHEARATERRLNAEEKSRQDREARLHALIREAKHELGDAVGEAWLDKPFRKLDGMSPRQAAAASDEKLQTARWVLDQVVAARAVKARWVDELERGATSLFGRSETDPQRLKTMVALYMTNSDPNLPNRVSPKGYTKDEATMRECLALLKQRIGKR